MVKLCSSASDWTKRIKWDGWTNERESDHKVQGFGKVDHVLTIIQQHA